MSTKAPAETPGPPSGASMDLSELLGYRLNRLSMAIGQLADQDAAEVAGLTLPEYRVTVILMSQGPMGVAGLQQAMLIDKAWVSRTLTRLVDKGIAVSAADQWDGRRTTFRLTPKGRKAASALIATARKRQQKILRGLSDKERVALTSLLGRVQLNVDAIGRDRE